MNQRCPALVIMGVAGCGKTSVAAAVCQLTGTLLIEGDQFHPVTNVNKMQAGIPLTDEDRAGWLDRLAVELTVAIASGRVPILACSALKQHYRDRLRRSVPDLGFVYLMLPQAVAAERVANRLGHFMPSSLVASQFATLQPPFGEPNVLSVDATLPLAGIVDAVKDWWQSVP
ncbi:gluconokinase [Chitinivorax sp. B]|uniref:gluconokinase n=1 Tax=Chitinivorax sp. B TaxID=2502235 RepID=UPI0010F4511A|nr:gluconokinase [Chitinivorax sp. B]